MVKEKLSNEISDLNFSQKDLRNGEKISNLNRYLSTEKLNQLLLVKSKKMIILTFVLYVNKIYEEKTNPEKGSSIYRSRRYSS